MQDNDQEAIMKQFAAMEAVNREGVSVIVELLDDDELMSPERIATLMYMAFTDGVALALMTVMADNQQATIESLWERASTRAIQERFAKMAGGN